MHRFEAALRLLDERCRVYQYLIKRTVDPFVAAPCASRSRNEAIQRRARLPQRPPSASCTTSTLYLVLLYEAPTAPRPARGFGTSGARRATPLRDLAVDRPHRCASSKTELDRAIATLHHKAQAFEVQLSEVRPTAPGEGATRSGSSGSLLNYDARDRRRRAR